MYAWQGSRLLAIGNLVAGVIRLEAAWSIKKGAFFNQLSEYGKMRRQQRLKYCNIGKHIAMSRKFIFIGFFAVSGMPSFASDTSGLIPFFAVMIGGPSLVLTLIITLFIYCKVRQKTVWLFSPFMFLGLCLFLYSIVFGLGFY